MFCEKSNVHELVNTIALGLDSDCVQSMGAATMTNTDRVLDYLQKRAPGRMTNSELSKAMRIKPHQQVFQITSRLVHEGKIRGIKRDHEWSFWISPIHLVHPAPASKTI